MSLDDATNCYSASRLRGILTHPVSLWQHPLREEASRFRDGCGVRLRRAHIHRPPTFITKIKKAIIVGNQEHSADDLVLQ